MSITTVKKLLCSKVPVVGLDDCWEWTAYRSDNGYGHFSTGPRHECSIQPHRTAYLLTRGEIPEGLDVRHTCHNRGCCNPSHLISGTRQDNMDDQLRSGRRPFGDRHHRAKISELQAELIRVSKESLEILSNRYGVSKALISLIRNLRSRRKLADQA